MKSQGKHFWLLMALLLAGGAVVNFWAAAGEARVARQPLVTLPTEVGGWRQVGADWRFDRAVEEVLAADDYVARDYRSPDGRLASLYVGYYKTQRTGATYHSPLNCLPGSGWTMSEAAMVEIKPSDGGDAFEANRYIVEHGQDRQLLVYWYQGRGRAVANEYWDKVYTVLDSIRLRRSDGAMVRVLVPVRGSEEQALETARAFAAQLAPGLPAHVPN
ncbi:MAG TPA: EpsI family protein [Pyrinomonadaceae bacterium]|jgi:EpsI family protein|nr:EpsI family protein [Pyrinomonadaceae bacterium]